MSSCSVHSRSRRLRFFLVACGCLLTLACHGFSAADEPAKKGSVIAADAQPKPPVFGRIVDDLGKPVTDAEVALQASGYFQTQTDEDGRYEFLDEIRPGEYRLSVKSKRWVGITDYRKLPRLLVTVEDPVEKNLTLKRACQFEIQVENEQGKPIRGATLYCSSLGDERRRTLHRSTTDNKGRVTIGGVAPSEFNYIIAATDENYAASHAIVSANEPDEVRAVKIVMKVGQPIRGKAICSDGEPAAGWRILALPDWWRFSSYPAGAVIAEDGAFELPHIDDRDYNVTISIPKGNGISSSRPVLTGVNLLGLKQPIDVTLDYPSPGSMNYLTGKIRWIGKPLDKGFSISGFSYEGRHHMNGHINAGAKEFKIGPAPPGTYRIRPEHPELECMNLRKIKNLSDLDHVKLPNEKPVQIVLRVRGKPQLRGSVIDEATKEPIERFRYRVTKLKTLSGPNYVEDDHWVQVKDAEGRFEKDVNGPGIYTVSVVADGYAINASEEINTDDEPDKTLVVALGRGFPLRGTVVDTDGRKVDGATVRVLSLASGSMPRVKDRFVSQQGAVKTKNGAFVFENLREGYETIRVTHPDFVFSDAGGIPISETSKSLEVILKRGATIKGRVFDHLGRPQPNVTLLFQDDYAYGGGDREAGRFGKVTTGADGTYRIEHVPAQPCFVSRTEEWKSLGVVRQALLPVDGETHELNLGGTSRLSGQLIINGTPAVDVRLQLGGPDATFGAMKMFARTNQEGRFTFFGTPAGHWTLYREIDGSRSDWVKIRELDAPAEDDLDIGVIRRRVGRLTVKCETKAGALPERLRMELQQYNPTYAHGRAAARVLARESPDVPFVFEGVSPGDYELVCQGAGEFEIRERIKLTDADIDSTLPLEIPIGNAKITAEIRSSSGESIVNYYCMIWGDEGRIVGRFKTITGDDGVPLHIAQLPAGKYKVRLLTTRDADVIEEFELADKQDLKIKIALPQTSKTRKGRGSVVTTDEFGVLVPCLLSFSGDGSQHVEQRPSRIKTMLSGPAGEYIVRIDQPGFEPQEQTIELAPNFGKKSELRVRLRRKGPKSD